MLDTYTISGIITQSPNILVLKWWSHISTAFISSTALFLMGDIFRLLNHKVPLFLLITKGCTTFSSLK